LFCKGFLVVYEHMFATLETLALRRRELDAAEAAWTRDVAAYDRSDDWPRDTPARRTRSGTRVT